MFPINLQKNIDQLGRQISLLENECKNMEMEKKRRNMKPQPPFCSKSSDMRPKPTVKVPVKQTNSYNRTKKISPPLSGRLHAASSHCSKSYSENNGSLGLRRKGLNTPAGSSALLGSTQTTSRNVNRCSRCLCCNESLKVSELDHGDSTERAQKRQVLHKEVLFPPYSGGAIEVTVTQKPTNGKESSLGVKPKTPNKVDHLENEVEKALQSCRCQGQKWAEILSSEKKQTNCWLDERKNAADQTKVISHPTNLNNQKECEYYNIKANHQNEIYEVPVKLPSQSSTTKLQSETNPDKFEKETQCSLQNVQYEPPDELPSRFDIVYDELFRMHADEHGRMPITKDILAKLQKAQIEEEKENRERLLLKARIQNNSKTSSQNSALQKNLCEPSSQAKLIKPNCEITKPNYENLIKEKEILFQDLATKDDMIKNLKKREEEYLALIASLKSSLEKTKGNVQENSAVVKELNSFKSKFHQQMKVTEALKENLTRMQETVERCTLENDTLKTQIKILKLEAQKHEVLLAGKEAQIERYKEEIMSFQRQISDHLASLKCNAQAIDIEKMMEAIAQQTQLFNQLEEDSVLEKDQKDTTLQNALMHSTPHSSPPSTKTSIGNSSWKQISSIHGHDLSKANSDFAIYLNDDSKKKDFFQIFGRNSHPGSKKAKKSREPSFEELLNKKEIKRSSSFTSCLTGEDDQTSVKSTTSFVSKETLNSVDENPAEELKQEKISVEVAQKNIEKLLETMKLKFSKEIFDTTLNSGSTEDFPDFSQISTSSPVQ